MEFATGALGTILPKLGELLLKEYNLKDTIKNGIEDLKAELEIMKAALEKISNVPLDQLDTQVKLWANEVRDLSYVIEDSLNSFMTHVDDIEPTKPKVKHLLKKLRNEFTMFKARHEIADDMKYIESQFTKIKESKVSDLVGMDEAIDGLTKMLSETDGLSGKNIKTISVVGFGGLGKTTLAKAVYDKLNKKFDCGRVLFQWVRIQT